MNRQELQIAFQKPYQQGAWLDILRAVLPGTEIFGKPQPIEIDHQVAQRVLQLGRVRLNGGRQLAVLEIEVSDRIDVVRNRVGLRNFVARFIDQERAHGVLAVFLSPEQDFRFTFAAKESVFADDGALTSKETAPRRFTYVLGPNEPCRTPAERFAELSAKAHDATLDDVIAAFSVEKLNKEFFTDFCRAFDFVCDNLRKQHKWPDAVVKAEAQTLLNRLLFLYFVQRKGWLNRERTFLVSNFRRHYQQSAKGITFFTEFLQPLFERLSTEELPLALTELDVPFLNGGLFNDEYADEQSDEAARRRRNLHICNDTFHEVFENLLERYNFTVHEDSPSHFEVAIDPEMLGRIFEELVLRGEESESGGKSARHDTGSHYTPRPIVHYICRESLAGWLESQPPFVGKPDARKRINTLLALDASEGIDEETKKALRDLLTPDEAAALGERLLELRACDLAVGSGAFPMGLLHELLNLLRLAATRARGQDPVEGDRDWLYENKKRIIEKVIYGVDIQGRATEICKLRLWLSLMVDHDLGVDPFNCDARSFRSALKKLEPLPNLDFKIRRANSLRDTIHGEPVRLFGGGHDVSGTEMALNINRLAEAKHEFYGARKAAEKRRWRLEVYRHLFEIAEHHLNQLITEATGLILDEGDEEKVAKVHQWKSARIGIKPIKSQIADALKSRTTKTQRLSALERLDAYLDDPERSTFVWELDFAEVFFVDRDQKPKGESLLPDESTGKRDVVKRRGFDLMLGNPPYIRLQTLKKDSPGLVEYYKQRYHSASKGNYDLYVCFVERGIELLHEQGQLGYILPHKFFNAQYGEPLREIISGRYESRVNVLRHIVHFADQQIFPGATNYVCLLFLAKAGEKEGCRFVNASNLKAWLHSQQGAEGIIPAKDIKETVWNFVVGHGSALFERLRAMPLKLGDVADIFVGLQTSADDVFIMNFVSETAHTITLNSKSLERHWTFEKELLHPIVSGTDVSPYAELPSRQFVLFPYQVENEQAELIPLETLSASWPRTAEYLKETKKRLEERESGKLKDTSKWHGYIYLKNMTLQSVPKLCVPRLVEYLHAAPDLDGAHFLDNVDVGGVTFKDSGSGHSLAYLLALLNSRLLRWYFPQISAPFRGGFRSANKQFLSLVPFRSLHLTLESERTAQDAIVRLVEWLSWLHTQPSVSTSTPDHPRDPLIAAYFEQWVSALVYELYFPVELHAAGLHFFDLTAQHTLPPLPEWNEKTERLPKIRERFEQLYDLKHPLRASLFSLGSLELVRIIEDSD